MAFVAASLLFGLTIDPNPPRMAVVFIFVIVAAMFWLYRVITFGTVKVPYPVLVGLIGLAWAALSLFWSPDARQGGLEVITLAAYLAVFAFVASAPKRLLHKAVGPAIFGAVILALVGVYLYPSIHGGLGNENFASEYFILTLPFLFVYSIKTDMPVYSPMIIVLAVLVYLVGFNASQEKYFILAGLYLLYAALHFGHKHYLTGALLLASPVFGLIALDWHPSKAILASIFSRLEIGASTLFMWLSSPGSALYGHGAGSYNYTYPMFQESYLKVFPNIETIFVEYGRFVGAAHNEYLQVLAEYGLVGFVVLIAFIASLYRRGPLDAVESAALWSIGLAAWLSLISFPAQNVATGVVLAFSAGVLARRVGYVSFSLRWPQKGAMAAAVIALVGTFGLVGYKTVLAHVYYTNLIGNYRADGVKSFIANLAAYQTFSWPHEIRQQLVFTFGSMLAKDHKRIRLDPRVADKVYKISKSASGRTFGTETARLEYLLNSGRWQTEPDEVKKTRDWMRSNAKTYAAFWVIEGNLALLEGDNDAAFEAVRRGFKAPLLTESYYYQLKDIQTRLGEIH